MLDSILIVAETARKFRFDIAIDRDYPMQSALNAFVRPIVLETPGGPPAGRPLRAGRFISTPKTSNSCKSSPCGNPNRARRRPRPQRPKTREASTAATDFACGCRRRKAGTGRQNCSASAARLTPADRDFRGTAGLSHPPHRRRHRLPGADGSRNPRYRAAIRPNPTGGELYDRHDRRTCRVWK